ncbi:Unknown protein, partial [Striga hermonthica]
QAEFNALTWDRMKEVIMEKYYPQSYRMRMERAFWDLKQGAGSFEEYEPEFTRMSAFAPHMVDTDLKKAHKFRDGLNRTLRMHVASQGNLSFDETVIRAVQLESYQTLDGSVPSSQLVQPISSAPPGSSSGKRKFDSRRDNRKGKCGAPDCRDVPPAAQGQNPKCPKCGRYHYGDCRFTQKQKAGGQARVYTIAHDEAANNADTMSGMISLSNVPILALCNTGATHSFISSQAWRPCLLIMCATVILSRLAWPREKLLSLILWFLVFRLILVGMFWRPTA